MSAETEMESLLVHARQNVEYLAASAAELVAESVAVLEDDAVLPKPPAKFREVGIWVPSSPVFQPDKQPLGFPSWVKLELPSTPDMQGIDEVSGEIDAELVALTFPSFIYPTIADPPTFTKTAPAVDTSFVLPVTPDLSVPIGRDRMGFSDVSFPAINEIHTDFAPITANYTFDPAVFSTELARFQSDIFGGKASIPGVDTLLAELRAWNSNALTVILPALMPALTGLIKQQFAPLQTLHSQIRARLDERLWEARDRVLVAVEDGSGWDRPAQAQQALRNAAEQLSRAWMAQAQAQADTKAAELNLALLEASGEVFDQLQRSVVTLKAREIELVLEAHSTAIAYAKQVIAALLVAFEAENFLRQDIDYQVAVAKLSVQEAELKMAMIRYEIAKAKLEVEKSKQDQDSYTLALYQADAEKAQLDARLYTEQVSAGRSELELIKLPLDLFELQVRAFDARMDAYQAAVSSQLARIEGDNAKVRGELAKVEAFEAKVTAFTEKINTQQIILTSQADRNKAILDEFEKQARLALFGAEQVLLKNQYDLAKYQVNADDALADAKIALDKASVELDYLTRKQDGVQKALDITYDQQLELLKIELSRFKAIAETHADGARLTANMAEGAITAINGIANVIFSESV